MRINKRTLFFFIPAMIALSACTDAEEEATTEKTGTIAAKDEFEGIEVLFNEDQFSDPRAADLLKEINICSDVQTDDKGNLMTPCTPDNFKLFPLKEGTPLEDGFILLVKANTGGFALRRILVFEREGGALVKVNGFIANLIGKKKKQGSNDDLLLRFIDKIEGSDVYYHCIFSWENGKYVFKTVEVIQEPAGNFSGIVKENVKDSVSQEIYKIITDNQMLF
ncbi:MAG: hypothetical protein KF704_06760 [Crocinitomicaceae bacterium]|nr:hypothetical protein [Crocinitomicaceae bacterium]